VDSIIDQQLLREILMREIDTIHRYQEMLKNAKCDDLQRFLAHAIVEEKEHVAEALQILRDIDPGQRDALEKDHSEHFRADGPGERALAQIRGEPMPEHDPAPAATEDIAETPAAADHVEADAAEDSSAPEPATSVPTDLLALTVGNLRER